MAVRRLLPVLLCLALPGCAGTSVAGGGDPGARYAAVGDVPEDVRAATFAFAPAVAPADRDAFAAAVAGARPEARRLVELVDGLVDVQVGAVGEGAAGETRMGGPRYLVTVDLHGVAQRHGVRGINRLVLHELAHVLDHALVTAALDAQLDEGVPAGWGCEGGVGGACAAREERFAESFAKWATNDIGVDIHLGYKVPPPEPTLEAWGAPLAALGA